MMWPTCWMDIRAVYAVSICCSPGLDVTRENWNAKPHIMDFRCSTSGFSSIFNSISFIDGFDAICVPVPQHRNVHDIEIETRAANCTQLMPEPGNRNNRVNCIAGNSGIGLTGSRRASFGTTKCEMKFPDILSVRSVERIDSLHFVESKWVSNMH